ncbi:radical SAM/SPASM domain-containing protein [Methanolobus psychrotolerans]|uniref:radical SAM/SPASM domain-containing protein n=1 Tax=Methanolobus psychrotolerans TaxID=1874706 RepID=UPI000B91844E|nr:radical SAM protein [Methanolobus psychrotolerans]
MRVYDKSVIKVNAGTENGKVVLDAEGPLSPVAKPIIKRINKIFQEEKPIHADEDNIIFSTWTPPMPGDVFNRMISAQVSAILKKRIPDQFSIGITTRCPNNCIHCGAADIVAEPILGFDEINCTIQQAIDIGSYHISFDGGETMLRKDLEEMVAKVDKSRAIATCFTSGFGLNEKRATDLKAAGLFAAHMSLDSPYEREHDRVRGRDGAFKDTVNGIKSISNAGILADLFVVVSPDNIDDLDEFYNFATDMGMQEMSIYEIIAVGRWMGHEDEVITAKDVEYLGKFQKSMNKKEDGPRVTAFPHFMGPDQFGCFAGRRWMHATAGGDILPCAYTPLSFGNIREEKLAAIWERLGRHEAYKCSAEYCMMRNPEFRSKYIRSIPEGTQLPIRLDKHMH